MDRIFHSSRDLIGASMIVALFAGIAVTIIGLGREIAAVDLLSIVCFGIAAVAGAALFWLQREDKAARAALAEERDQLTSQLRLIGEVAPCALVASSATDGSVLFANSEAARMAEAQAQIFPRKKNIAAYYADPGQRAEILEELERYGVIRGKVVSARTESGKRIWVSVNARRAEIRGEPVYIATIQDISALKTAQDSEAEIKRQWKAFVDNAPVHIFMKGLDRRYLFANGAYVKFLGCTPEDVVGKLPEDVLPGDAAQRHAEHDKRVISDLAPVEYREDLCVGDRREVVQTTKFPVLDRQGDLVAIGGVAIPITREVELEKQAHLAAKMEAVGRLTSGIAHDFNNMLSIATGSAELISTLAPDDDIREAADAIVDAIERGSELSSKLMRLARDRADSPSIVNPNHLLKANRAFLQRALGEDIELRLEVDDELWAIYVDPSEFENVVLNLAVNARDAMPDGGALTIECENHSLCQPSEAAPSDLAPGEYVRFSVADNGVGIPQNILDKVMEPYFTTKSAEKGTGLGLAMVHAFAKKSGGSILIGSVPDGGTTVTLWLPKCRTADDRTATGPAASDEDLTGEGTVLLAEDQKLVRRYIAAQLESLGYSVIKAASGREALDLLENGGKHVDLLLVDLVMPGELTGRRLAQLAAASAPGLKVLFMTGYTDSEMLSNTPGISRSRVLRKPFRRDVLGRRLREILDPLKRTPCRRPGNPTPPPVMRERNRSID